MGPPPSPRIERKLSMQSQSQSNQLEAPSANPNVRSPSPEKPYQGVSRLLPHSDEKRLVVDIGGRSTEMILGQGYTARSVRTCGGRFCVHRVRKSADRATAAWARTTLEVMDRVWRNQVGGLGYRAPLSDGGLPRSRNGGRRREKTLRR